MKKILFLFLCFLSFKTFAQYVSYSYSGYVNGVGYVYSYGSAYFSSYSGGSYSGTYRLKNYYKEPKNFDIIIGNKPKGNIIELKLDYCDLLGVNINNNYNNIKLFDISVGVNKDSLLNILNINSLEVIKITGDLTKNIDDLTNIDYNSILTTHQHIKITDLCVINGVEVYYFSGYKPNDDFKLYGYVIFKNNELIYYDYDFLYKNVEFDLVKLFNIKNKLNLNYEDYFGCFYLDKTQYFQIIDKSKLFIGSYKDTKEYNYSTKVTGLNFNEIKNLTIEYLSLVFKSKQNNIDNLYNKY